eukprot:Tbor_TRINITY_DN4320_c0_g1::TRINITY_DN4320_c0_g1_i1::g.7764::m.7764
MRSTLLNFTQCALIQTTAPHLMRFDKEMQSNEMGGSGKRVNVPSSPSFINLPDSMKPVSLDASFTPYPLPKKDADFEYGPTRLRNAPDVHAARRAELQEIRRHAPFQEAEGEEDATSENIFDILEDITPLSTTEKDSGSKEKDSSRSETSGSRTVDIEDDDEDELTSDRMRSSILRAQEDIRKAAAAYAKSKDQSRSSATAAAIEEEEEGANKYTLVESKTMLNVHVKRSLGSLLQQLDDSFLNESKDVRHCAAIFDLGNTLDVRTHDELVSMFNHISEKFDFRSSTGSHFLRYYTVAGYRNLTEQMEPCYSIVNAYLFFLKKLEAYFTEGKGKDLIAYDELDQFQAQAALAAYNAEAPSASDEASLEHIQRLHSNKVELIAALFKTLAHLKVLDMDSWTTSHDHFISNFSTSVQQVQPKKDIQRVDDLGLDLIDRMYEAIAFGADASTEEGMELSFVARTSTSGLVALLKGIVGVNAKQGLLDDLASPVIIQEVIRRAKSTRLEGVNSRLPPCSLQEIEETWLLCTMCMYTDRTLITEVFEMLNACRCSGDTQGGALGPEGLLALSKLYLAVPSINGKGSGRAATETPSFNDVNSISLEDRQRRIITELKASVARSRQKLEDAKAGRQSYEKAALNDTSSNGPSIEESTTEMKKELDIAVKRAYGVHYRMIHASQEVLASITPISKATAICKELDLDTDAIAVIPPLRDLVDAAFKMWNMKLHNNSTTQSTGELKTPRARRIQKMDDLRKKATLESSPLQMEVSKSLPNEPQNVNYFSVFNDTHSEIGFLRSVGGNTHTLRNYEKILIFHSTFITANGDSASMISHSLKKIIQGLVTNTSTAMVIPTSTLLELVRSGKECPYPEKKKRIWRSLALLCAAARDTHRNIFIMSLSDELSLLRQECGGPLGEDQIVWLTHHYLQQSINPAATVTVCCDKKNISASPDMVLNGRGGLTAIDRDIGFRHMLAETRFMRNGTKYGAKKDQRDALIEGSRQVQSSEIYMFAIDCIKQAKMRVLSPQRQVRDIGKSFAERLDYKRGNRWACRDAGIREKIRIGGERNIGFALGSKVDISGLGLLSVGHPSVDRSKFPLEVKKNWNSVVVKRNTRRKMLAGSVTSHP